MKTNSRKTIIFDLDGTIYRFKGDSFRSSGLYDVIIKNTLQYISNSLNKSEEEAQKVLDIVLKKYGNSISIGLENEFKIDRYDYFDFTWNIDPKDYVQFDPRLKLFLLNLGTNFNLVLLSDAPKVWVHGVLEHLVIKEFFGNNIFSGEGNTRKEFGNAFQEVCKVMKIEASNCVSVGDQEETDIVPAKEMGMKTVYIANKKSIVSDYTINNIVEVQNIIAKVW